MAYICGDLSMNDDFEINLKLYMMAQTQSLYMNPLKVGFNIPFCMMILFEQYVYNQIISWLLVPLVYIPHISMIISSQ